MPATQTNHGFNALQLHVRYDLMAVSGIGGIDDTAISPVVGILRRLGKVCAVRGFP